MVGKDFGGIHLVEHDLIIKAKKLSLERERERVNSILCGHHLSKRN